MPPAEFEPTVSSRELPQTYALDRAVTGIGLRRVFKKIPILMSEITVFQLFPNSGSAYDY